MKMNWFDRLTWLLVTIGALNWGLVGFFDYNLVTSLFGADSTATEVVYDAIGVSALWGVWSMVSMAGKKAKD